MTTTRCLLLLAALGAAAAALGAREPLQRTGSPRIARRDAAAEANLLSKLHAIDELEIAIGRLASQRGADARVRRYGDVLLHDHRIGDRAVVELARARDLRVSAPAPGLQERELLSRLRAARGAEFDRELLAGMERGHHQALALLETKRPGMADVAIRRLIEKLVPVLEEHRMLAGGLQHQFAPAHG